MVVSAIEKEKIRTRQGVLEAQRLGFVLFLMKCDPCGDRP